MKKIKPPTEQELYYAAKNKSLVKWRNFRKELGLFFISGGQALGISALIVIGFFCLAMFLTMASYGLYKIGAFRDIEREFKDYIRQEITSHPSREVIHTHEYIYQEAPKPQLIYTNWNLSTNFMGTNFTTNFLITNINWFPKTYYFTNGTWK